MKIKDYIKERWYMFAVFTAAAVFAAAVYVLEGEPFFQNTGAAYVLSGIALFFLIFVAADYFILRHRVIKMASFIKTGGTEEADFTYPSDRVYAEKINRLADEFNAYRAKAAGEAAEDLDFVTRWVHDVKVPISAMKLMLETDSDDLKERLEMELMSVEQNTQKVLFNIKSKSLYDDYSISKAGTKELVAAALKQFAAFFAFKKINLRLDVADFPVLTDKKWSIYIISQFISNAVKHTAAGGEIAICARNTAGGVAVSVANTGEGISKTDLDRVFSRGYTASGRDNPKATGYGLYLSKKLADKLGHTLAAESEEGEYAKFSLIFKEPGLPM
jgi:signal transduction histidine kinase